MRIRFAKAAVRLVVVLSVVMALPACGFDAASRHADDIVAAPGKVAAAGPASVRLAMSAAYDDVEGFGGSGIPALGMAAVAEAPPTDSFALEGTLDVGGRRAALRPEGVQDAPSLVFDGFRYFVRRADAKPREARPWIEADVNAMAEKRHRKIDPADVPPLATALTLHPVLLVDLMSGALAGSIKAGAVEDINGVPARRYTGRFAVDNAMRKGRDDAYDDDARRAVDYLLAAAAVGSEPHEGEVWIDDKGLPRRFVLALVERPRRLVKVVVTVQFDFRGFGEAPPVGVPGPAEIVEVEGLERFAQFAGRAAVRPVQGAS